MGAARPHRTPAHPPATACRVEERAAEAAAAGDEEAQLALRKLGRRVATVNEELGIYQRLIDKFRCRGGAVSGAVVCRWPGTVRRGRARMLRRCLMSVRHAPVAAPRRAAPSSDWEGLVSLSRSQLSTEFFKYLDLRIKWVVCCQSIDLLGGFALSD